MEFLYGLVGFLFGTAIGSFLNVVILRGEKGETPTGRSYCPACRHTLGVFDLIPLFSYALLRGKCRYCGAKISLQYPLVELTTALCFAGIFAYAAAPSESGFISSMGTALFLCVVASLLILIVSHDLREKIIPDRYVYAFIALGLASLFLEFPALQVSLPSILEFLAGPVLFAPFFFLWFVSHGRWIGLGDGKLVLGIGWFLGLELGFSAIIMAFWIGALVSVALLAYVRVRTRKSSAHTRAESGLRTHTHQLTMKSEVPFAPFLVLGFVLAAILELNVLAFAAFSSVPYPF